MHVLQPDVHGNSWGTEKGQKTDLCFDSQETKDL